MHALMLANLSGSRYNIPTLPILCRLAVHIDGHVLADSAKGESIL